MTGSLIPRMSTLFLILCLIKNSLCQAQVGFQVSPAKLYFTQKGTAEQTARLHVTNTMNVRLVLQTSCSDWRRDSMGTKTYYPAGSLGTSCCSLVKFTPSIIELAPGEARDVLVTLVASPQAKTSFVRNGMLFLTQSNEQEMARLQGASQFVIKVQMGVHLYVLPEEGLQPEIAITGMEVAKLGEQNLVKVQIHNVGGTLLESQLRLEYLNLDTMEEVKAEAIPVNTLPKEGFKITASIPSTVPPGKYLIVAILDSGPSQALKVAELEAVLK